jgi:hypothetical protein
MSNEAVYNLVVKHFLGRKYECPWHGVMTIVEITQKKHMIEVRMSYKPNHYEGTWIASMLLRVENSIQQYFGFTVFARL